MESLRKDQIALPSADPSSRSPRFPVGGAERGERPAAQLSTMAASASNALHGSLYEFIRNSDLDAHSFFDRDSAVSVNVFRAALGLPTCARIAYHEMLSLNANQPFPSICASACPPT